MTTTWHLVFFLGILSLGRSEPQAALFTPEQLAPQLAPQPAPVQFAPQPAPAPTVAVAAAAAQQQQPSQIPIQQYPPPQQQYQPPQQQYQPPQPQYQQQYPRQQSNSIQGNGLGNEREVSSPGGSQGFGKEHNDQSAQLGDFPYKVQIRHGNNFVGGGTLIRSPVTGRHLVITAAHIVTEKGSNGSTSHPVDPQTLSLRMGIIYKDDIGEERRVIKNFVHPGYIYWKQEDRPIFNDIAILVPDRQFDTNDHVQTLALPIADWPVAHESVVVKGWGVGREAGHTGPSTFLRYFSVPVWDSYRCDSVYYQESGLDLITKKHFCAGFEDGRKDSCGGDSGAAAMGKREGIPYFAGIVSWGKGCGTPGYPGVYTRVSGHLDWIKQTMYAYEKFGYL